jgi:hypothetical protein
MNDRFYRFKGYFRAGQPTGDTLRYLQWSNAYSIEDAIVRAFSIFYYPKVLKMLAVPLYIFDEAKDQSISYCWSAIADLDKLENTVLQLPSDHKSVLKQRSLGSQYEFDVSIDTSKYDLEFLLEALAVFETGVIGKPKICICQAVSSLYHPLTANAFANPLNQVVDAIHCSREKFRSLLVDLGVKNAVLEAESIFATDNQANLAEKIQIPARKASITNW